MSTYYNFRRNKRKVGYGKLYYTNLYLNYRFSYQRTDLTFLNCKHVRESKNKKKQNNIYNMSQYWHLRKFKVKSIFNVRPNRNRMKCQRQSVCLNIASAKCFPYTAIELLTYIFDLCNKTFLFILIFLPFKTY